MIDPVLQSIALMEVNGNRLELPKQYFPNYAAVKKFLMNAGGKYKSNGFIFNDAQATKDALLGGEVIHDKKKFQFFATPPELAKHLISIAHIYSDHKVLEPSAGQGALVDLILEQTNNCMCIELMPENAEILRKKGYSVLEGDFLEFEISDNLRFDRIVANPPFTKNQDIDHILHMYDLLKPGGKMVSMASPSWTFGNQKKQKEFREGLDYVNATITEVPEGEFKSSGTNIRSVIIEILKREDS